MATEGTVATTDVVTTLQEKLNENSFYSLIGGIVDALQSTSGTASTELQDQINALATQLNTVQNEAAVLSTNELKQVEDALKQTLTNLEQNGFLGALCVSVGGQNYSIKDLVSRLAQVDKVVETEKVWNASFTEITSIKFKLEDGAIITFTPTIVEDDVSKNYTFAGNWKGIDVSFVANFAKVSRTTSVGGAQQTSVEFVPVKSSNVVFSLTTGLSNCVTVGVNDVVPDLNSDGVIGTPPATPTSMSASTSTVAVNTGSTSTVTVSNAEGTVTATSSNGYVFLDPVVDGNDVIITGGNTEGVATLTITDGVTIIQIPVTVSAATGDGMVI